MLAWKELLLATGLAVEAAAVGIPDSVKGTPSVRVRFSAQGAPPADAAERLETAVVDGLGAAFRPTSIDFAPRSRGHAT